ncbi:MULTISPECIES: cytoskeleton protein RodZ [Symbiopectobacterium]|uniref:cytoskeleton protein RodZ n=1 Tax=Symbiopectobacterium TaxID=801 RepID=UPI001A210F0B|nr:MULTISPECIES: cytoskeleton protein RodZ [Symbiopectobacterium]MBG6248595.1 cytoskeleton protein RodZ [Candidatus Symbiopectobacterium sp. PLON1]MBT9428797.1 cytoskeleton protein RodZ [Candidatus Symbiopectobacterium endolongispinus]
MNTEATLKNTTPATPGERLRQAREHMGLTQQTVAERLCLKVTTVREIEEGSTSPDLAPTFLRGYIRSYAKLVHLPESELLPALDKHVVPRIANVASMQGFALGKSRKKRDGWLMTFTWLVVLIVLGLTGAWWWQNYQVQQQEISSMVEHAAANTPEEAESQTAVPLATTGSQTIDLTQIAPAAPEGANTTANSASVNSPAANAATTTGAPVTPAQAGNGHQPVAPVTMPHSTATESAASQSATPVSDNGNTIAMTFSADCWLEVIDAAGKKLYSGVQRSGSVLNLSGQAPYRLKIGAPAAVQIQYQGKPVDLSRFVRSNQIVRLTLAAE